MYVERCKMKTKMSKARTSKSTVAASSTSKTPDFSYRRIFENARHGILILDAQTGVIEGVNPYLLSMLGYSSAELVGKKLWELGAFKNVEISQKEFETLQANETIRTENLPLRAKGGSIIEVEIVSYVYEENDRKVMKCEIRDVGARAQSNESLPPAEAELRALFDCMRDIVLVIDRRGVYREIAPTRAALLYRPPHELLGKSLRDVFPADQAQELIETIEQVLKTRQTAEIEYELPIGGLPMWFAASVSPMGKDRTLWVARDITESRQAAESLRTANADYQSLFDNATVGIYRSTPQGSFLKVNPAMARIFGYASPEEMIRGVTSIEKQSYVDPASRREFQCLLAEEHEVREFTTQARRREGETIWIRENARAVTAADGSVLYYEGFLTDITERKQSEQELQRVRDTLETINNELQVSLARQKTLARTDGLTGLCNRIFFDELATREFQAAVRYQRALTILMIDVDNFKKINDTLGHAAGDEVLTRIAHTASQHIRATDILARFGGDEFILLLPETNAQQALTVAERIRATVEATPIRDVINAPAVSLCIGIAELRSKPMDEGVEEVIRRADQALYLAKTDGRNRVVLWDSKISSG